MGINLSPEHQQLIAKAMKTGAYRNPEEVVGRALEILHLEDEWLQEHKDFIAEKIERAFAEFDRGEYLTAEESRADMEKRKTAWMRDHKR